MVRSANSPRERELAHEHLLRSDPRMAALVAEHGVIDPYLRPHTVPVHDGDLFEGLAFHIVGQSISERAALAIFARIRDMVGGTVTSDALAGASVVAFHGAGLSMAKARSLHGVAEAITTRQLLLDELRSLPDAGVVERLTAMPGIGPWTSEIFLLYELRRPDVFPAGEIGLRKAVGLLDELSSTPSTKIAVSRAEVWRPYRTYAAGHLWRSLARPRP
jgi:DNA-3-methyladenine glycosylase II